MEIIIEIIIELYGELMLLIVPEKKMSKKHIIIAKALAIFVLAGIFALVLWGGYLIFDRGRMIGILPISIAAIISVVQITLGIILYNKHH